MTESTDPVELSKFEASNALWWDVDGPLGPLHRFNPPRLAFIRDAALACLPKVENPGESAWPLRGLRILDVGCGGGLLTEPLARLGADVLGIDPVDSSIQVARAHAEDQGLKLNYKAITAERLSSEIGSDADRFDLVVASEVIEHVTDPGAFIHTLARLARPVGGLCLSTINRTRRSYLEAIVGAEYILGWLPRGTHDWERFVKPAEMSGYLRHAGFKVRRQSGIGYALGSGTFRLRRSVSTNYILFATRQREG